jgi:diguanylate cyclase (GGDEF)-like protein
MQRARAAGATDFIGKPFDAIHLLARTQAHANAYATNVSMRTHTMSLEEQVQVDMQTGLANESAFLEHGCQVLSYAVRHHTRLAVAQVEIDHFGNLFREHGKTATDLVLEHTASTLLASIRREDQAARIGTARFAILLPGMDRTGTRKLAERIAGEIRNRVIRDGNLHLRFTVSIGITAPDISQDSRLDDLLEQAGASLHEAIATGGDRSVVHATDSGPYATGMGGMADHGPEPDTAGMTEELAILPVSGPAGPDLEEIPEIIALPAVPDAARGVIEADDGLPGAQAVQDEPEPEYQLDEEIVITSPYGMFEPGQHLPAHTTDPASRSPDQEAGACGDPADEYAQPDTAGTSAAAGNGADGAGSHAMAPPAEASTAPPRAGLFRRLARRLFRTRGPAPFS